MKEYYKKQIDKVASQLIRLENLYTNWAKRRGENSYAIGIIYIIHVSNVQKQKEIVGNYGIPKQTVNTVVSQLIKDGYAVLETDKKDKRCKLIRLTPQGIKYAQSILTPLILCECAAMEKLGGKKVEELIKTLNEYSQFLEHEMDEYFDTNSNS